MNKRRLSFNTKINLALAIVGILVILGTSFFYFIQIQKLVTQQLFNRLSLVSDTYSGYITEFFIGRSNRTSAIASDKFIIDSLQSLQNSNNATSSSVLSTYLKQSKQPLDKTIIGMNITNRNGMVIASTDAGELGTNISDQTYFTQSISADYGHGHISDVLTSLQFGSTDAHIAISSPIFDGNRQQKLGVIVSYIATNQVSKVISGQRLVDLGIEDQANIDANNYGLLLTQANGSVIVDSTSPEAPPNTTLDTTLIQGCQTGHEYSAKYTNHHSIEVLGASKCLTDLNNWTFVIEISPDNIQSQLQDMIKFSLVIGTAAVGVMVLISNFFLSRILKPIRQLTQTAKQISSGNLTARVKLITQDEIGDMVATFNSMADQLSTYQLHLQDQVEKQTQDLKKFKMAIDNVSDSIIITDSNKKIIYANPATHKITGYQTEEVLGTVVVRDLLWKGIANIDKYTNLIESLTTIKQPFKVEIDSLKKDGTQYQSELIVSPLLDAYNQPLYFVGIQRDITHLKLVDRMKSEFISLASHQLRTPLTSIKWMVEMLIKGDLGQINPDQGDFLDKISQSNHRMIELVNALLNVSRLESGRLIIDPKSTQIADLANEVSDELAQKFQEKQLQLEKNFTDNLPQISIDPKLIRQVYLNLLTNAIKYTPNSGKITITITQNEHDITSQISDNGCGIPQKNQKSIFTKLYRADNAKQMNTDGNGLGLYLVKQIIEASSGTIGFKSKLSKGSTFWFTLPKSGSKPKQGDVTIDS